MEGKYFGGFYRFGEAVLFLFYINLLWVVFTFLGAVVFGWAPSTAAMFAVIRKWIHGESDRSAFKMFLEYYRKEFLKTNGLGLMLGFGALILYINISFFQVQNETLSDLIHYLNIGIAIVYGIVLIYIFPLFVHYESSFFQYFKNCILLAIFKPIRTLYTISACIAVFYFLYILPGMLPFLGVSLIGYVVMWTTHGTFQRMEDLQGKLQNPVQSL
jgi:uncharacterized membrane protein YesL